MLLLIVCLFCACGRAKTRLDEVSEDGYTVSVKFEANGGEFTTNCYTIVDSYNISGMSTNKDGMVELALIAPDNPVRGANDTFTVANAGYFLAGWYERTETVNENGEVVYTYTNKWDFENGRLKVDPNKTYSASEPQITLYAVWVPQFEINFYNMNTGELMDTKIFNPDETTFQVPDWDIETGEMKMYKFPKLNGYTFNGAYYDAAGTMPIEGTLKHHGYVDPETGAAVNPTMDVYIDWLEGNWYQIHTAQQLSNLASTKGNFVLCADLDFTGVEWPTAFYSKEFTGAIYGNGHTISNVTVTQSKIDSMSLGLFGKVGADAILEDITFENVTLKITKGFKTPGTAYGLFAGTISKDATITGVSVVGGTILIDSGIAFLTTDYVLGIVCGDGDSSKVSCEGVEVLEQKSEVGEDEEVPADSLQITVDGEGMITVTPIEP